MVRFLAFNVSRISAMAEDMARHLTHFQGLDSGSFSAVVCPW